MKKLSYVLMGLMVILLAFTGCSAGSDLLIQNDYQLTITGEGVNLILTGEDMKSMELETIESSAVDSAGNVTDVTVTGFSLSKLLLQHNIELQNTTDVTFTASDGYVMNAPLAEYEGSDIFVLLKYDGEALETPRSAIPGKRAMYWVKDLAQIDIASGMISASGATDITEIQFFFENASALRAESLQYDGTDVPSYSLRAYFDAFLPNNNADIFTLIARDGFDKVETADVFFSCYVSMLEGSSDQESNAPQYFSETLNRGMRVKQLDIVKAENVAIYFGNDISVSQLFDTLEIGGYDEYIFKATDGYETIIPAGAIEFGAIYPDDEEGYIRASFDGYDFGSTPGGGRVKYLSAIIPRGNRIEQASVAGDRTVLSAAAVQELTQNIDPNAPLFTVQANGADTVISEVEFMSLPLLELDISRTNSYGETASGTYIGVHWTEIADFVGVDENSAITVIASDGYEIKLSPEMLLDPGSIFGLYENGEYIESEGDGRLWFCVSENFTANNWAKYIVEIVVD